MKTLLHVINFGNAVALGVAWHLMWPWVALDVAMGGHGWHLMWPWVALDVAMGGHGWHLMWPWVAISLATLIILFEWRLSRLP